MDEPKNETHGALDLNPLDRVQVAHLFLKAAHDGVVLTDKEAKTAIKRMFPDLFGPDTLARLAAELLDCVERDAGKPHLLIRVQLDVESAPERP